MASKNLAEQLISKLPQVAFQFNVKNSLCEAVIKRIREIYSEKSTEQLLQYYASIVKRWSHTLPAQPKAKYNIHNIGAKGV